MFKAVQLESVESDVRLQLYKLQYTCYSRKADQTYEVQLYNFAHHAPGHNPPSVTPFHPHA